MSQLNIWQNSRLFRLGLALACSLALLLGLLLVMGAARTPEVALAQGPTIRYVAPAPTGDDSGNDCITSTAPCATIQHAVDVADPGDEIRVATGIYTGVQARAGVTQVVYISKTVMVRGGYTTTDWSTSNPVSYPTTLDAQEQGRVLYITGDISPLVGLGGRAPVPAGAGALHHRRHQPRSRGIAHHRRRRDRVGRRSIGRGCRWRGVRHHRHSDPQQQPRVQQHRPGRRRAVFPEQ